jgi:hypothetical protein
MSIMPICRAALLQIARTLVPAFPRTPGVCRCFGLQLSRLRGGQFEGPYRIDCLDASVMSSRPRCRGARFGTVHRAQQPVADTHAGQLRTAGSCPPMEVPASPGLCSLHPLRRRTSLSTRGTAPGYMSALVVYARRTVWTLIAGSAGFRLRPPPLRCRHPPSRAGSSPCPSSPPTARLVPRQTRHTPLHHLGDRLANLIDSARLLLAAKAHLVHHDLDLGGVLIDRLNRVCYLVNLALAIA